MSVTFSLNGTLKKNGSVGRWETKQFIGMALDLFTDNKEILGNQTLNSVKLLLSESYS